MAGTLPLSAFWLLYLGGLGLTFPYQALYFSENAGLSGTQLGLVLALRPLMGIVGQPVWGHLADRTGRRARVLALLAMGAAAGYTLVPFAAASFVPLIATVALASLFATSVIPMATSVSMAALAGRASEAFGRVRVWGTVGFLIAVVSFPFGLDAIQAWRGLEPEPGGPSEPGLEVIFWLAAGLSAAAALTVARLRPHGDLGLRAARGELRQLLRHPPYLRAIAFSFLAFFFLQAPINMLPILLRDRGGSIDTLGTLWIPMLLLEIPLVFLSGATLGRIGARGLLFAGVLADGVRWMGCVLAPSLWMLYGLQLLHGVVVAGLIMGVPYYVEQVCPERLRSSGQTFVAMVGVSLSAVLSNLVAGVLLERFGTNGPYVWGACGAFLLAAALPVLLPRPVRPAEAGAGGPPAGPAGA